MAKQKTATTPPPHLLVFYYIDAYSGPWAPAPVLGGSGFVTKRKNPLEIGMPVKAQPIDAHTYNEARPTTGDHPIDRRQSGLLATG